MLNQLDVIESLDVLKPVLVIFMLIFLLGLMLVFYNKHTYSFFLPMLLVFLFSIVIGVSSIIESSIPFSPYFQLFFILMQFVLFILFIMEFL